MTAFFVLFCFFQDRVSLYSPGCWLSWSSLCRPGWPQTQKSSCLCLQSAWIKGLRHHAQSSLNFLKKSTNIKNDDSSCVCLLPTVIKMNILWSCSEEFSTVYPESRKIGQQINNKYLLIGYKVNKTHCFLQTFWFNRSPTTWMALNNFLQFY